MKTNWTLVLIAAGAAYIAAGGKLPSLAELQPNNPSPAPNVQPVGPAVPQALAAEVKAAFTGRTDARAYAAFYQGVGDYIQQTGDYAGPSRWVQRVRGIRNLADNPALRTLWLRDTEKFKPFVTPEQWTEAAKLEFLQLHRNYSAACLAAA